MRASNSAGSNGFEIIVSAQLQPAYTIWDLRPGREHQVSRFLAGLRMNQVKGDKAMKTKTNVKSGNAVWGT